MRPHLLLAAALLPPTAAAAQTDASRTLDQLAECRAITGDAERLACFDGLAGRIASARKSGDLLVLDRRKVVERKRARFGLANPTDEVLDGGEADRATRVAQLDTTVRAVAAAKAYGRWNLELANGSVWQSIDALMRDPKAGEPITIRTAALGGFRASVNNGRTFLVKRIR